MFQIPSSLVKYYNPILISTTTGNQQTKPSIETNLATAGLNGTSAISALSHHLAGVVAGRAPVAGDSESPCDNIELLNSLLPPREWKKDGEMWVQKVCSVPATTTDVANLEEELDVRLRELHARETGLCLIRRELYSQCFDELIRQVTISCAERGMLLGKIREELQTTITGYQEVYESNMAFGARKALLAKQRIENFEKTVQKLEEQKQEIRQKIKELKTDSETTGKLQKRRQMSEESKRAEEIERLKKQVQYQRNELSAILASSKKQ